ncbi:xanthine dehydrogenase family protein molybdopterin-binding subunit [Pseudoroseicyclus tamaricis]|uniref:Xanthine dehydrogenase family protein molybdopterin-binding subunit n=1 Tax=Pseudoroseicyclus tamaricis TaxID=2705421 RepID=A0A6B2JN00_9RHOB|nr:xanthine dehydrogenase family protein molybdopterin-binding subunit [Pseudoroseicyclus tamaricis]NDU99387.1 xanthine dehydrogenase family protein molybdopterin-binding subunit [Pseudoroseicyclus tamaricis]
MSYELKVDDKETTDRAAGLSQGLLGTAADRPEGVLKVTGRATYAAEDMPEGTAFGVLVRAPAMGRVELGNAPAVEKLPGVLAVIHDKRMLRNPAQGMAGEAPVQGVAEADYVGQPIALVVAGSFEQARHAAEVMEVRCLGEIRPVSPGAVEPEVPEKKQSSMGDLDAAMAAAVHKVDATYSTSAMSSAAMEPHAALAWWEGDKLTVRASLQMLKYNRAELADSVGIPLENVRILSPYVGGGFGSKLGVSPEVVAAAIAAQQLGRPVRVVLNRRQVFETITRRSETEQHIRLAADGEGRLTGVGHDALVSNLPEEPFSEPVTQATPFNYEGAARTIGHRVARIHRPAAGSVRAPGEAVGVTAFEIAMDELAVAAGIDPVELRLRNIPAEVPGTGKPFSSHMLAESLNDGAARFGWADRAAEPRARREGEWWIGSGVASAFRVNMLSEAEARVVLGPEGAIVETDMTDIGTGTYAILGQIAGELLGLPQEKVEVRLGDTAFPPGSGSGGSIGAASTGTAVWLAAQEVRAALAKEMGCEPDDLTLKDGRATCGNISRDIAELISGESLEGHGHVQPGDASSKVKQATFGAHFAEVAVNDVTGEVRVRRMLGSFAAGRILNLKTARSQCHGGMTWGIGMALTEELVHDRRDGHMVNRDLAEYHVAVNADVPPLEVHFLEERDPWTGPMQVKGIGELGICGAAAAILNAIHHASGVRLRDLPATPDKVLAGLEELG